MDTAGNQYVADTDNNRVVKLGRGPTTRPCCRCPGYVLWGIAVDRAGDVFGANTTTTRWSSWRPVFRTGGAGVHRTEHPLDVAVDKDGNVYVADRGDDRVLKIGP